MLFTPCLLAACLAQAPVPASHPERAAVEMPLKAYFRYHQTGDPKGLAEAFHPEALLQWSKAGKRMTLSQADWQKSAAEKLATSDPKAKRLEVKCEIAWVEISGDVAVAKVILDYPTFRFIDFMHLLKLKEGWKIVDKIYDRKEGMH